MYNVNKTIPLREFYAIATPFHLGIKMTSFSSLCQKVAYIMFYGFFFFAINILRVKKLLKLNTPSPPDNI